MSTCRPATITSLLGLTPTVASTWSELGVVLASQGDDMDRLLPLLTVLTSTAGLAGAIWVAVSMLF